MGCRQSSLSPMDKLAYEYILTNIPLHSKQEIIKLPKQKFLNIYGKHLTAEAHLARQEYLTAIVNESQAIADLEILLHQHKDHFIFADMHKLLSICYVQMENIELAFVNSLIALAIRIKHTPTDYTEISLQFFRLSLIYLAKGQLNGTEECLERAIITGRLCTALPHSYVQELEETLACLRRRRNVDSRLRPIVHTFTSKHGESQEDFLRRTTIDDMIPIYTEIGALQLDRAEYERIPDKQTESQITDEILNNVLQALETYLTHDSFLLKFGASGGCASFIAAYFKATQMKNSSLLPAMIEAALTIIINRIDDEQYTMVKQSPFLISYTDDDESRVKGVRVFQVKRKNTSDAQ